MTMTPIRKRSTPALSMNFLVDSTGGAVVDRIEGVTSFHGAPDVLAGPVSARLAFGRVAANVAEIIAKVSPGVKLPLEPTGVLQEADAVVTEDAGLSLHEANTLRLALNGYIETAAHLTALYAAEKGLAVPYRCHVSGDYKVRDGALVTLPLDACAPARPGLGVAELNAALARWADCIATIAAVVNAAPEVTVAVSSKEDDAETPAE